MLIETTLGDVPWSDISAVSGAIERVGFDGIGTPELKADPFLPLVVAAAATAGLREGRLGVAGRGPGAGCWMA